MATTDHRNAHKSNNVAPCAITEPSNSLLISTSFFITITFPYPHPTPQDTTTWDGTVSSSLFNLFMQVQTLSPRSWCVLFKASKHLVILHAYILHLNISVSLISQYIKNAQADIGWQGACDTVHYCLHCKCDVVPNSSSLTVLDIHMYLAPTCSFSLDNRTDTV